MNNDGTVHCLVAKETSFLQKMSLLNIPEYIQTSLERGQSMHSSLL